MEITIENNCYKCRYRGNVPGDTHSCCRYPENETGLLDFFSAINQQNAEKFQIRADRHGIEHGWFYWPINFDPIWLRHCNGFTEKDTKVD